MVSHIQHRGVARGGAWGRRPPPRILKINQEGLAKGACDQGRMMRKTQFKEKRTNNQKKIFKMCIN